MIYYPEQKMDLMEEEMSENELDCVVSYYDDSSGAIARFTASKYTRSKVRKAMPRCLRTLWRN